MTVTTSMALAVTCLFWGLLTGVLIGYTYRDLKDRRD